MQAGGTDDTEAPLGSFQGSRMMPPNQETSDSSKEAKVLLNVWKSMKWFRTIRAPEGF